MIDFSGYTKAKIESDMLQQVDPNIDTREGSMVQTAVAPGAWEFEEFYLLLSQIQQNSNIETAVGTYLDLFVLARGLVRIPATPAVRQGTFLDDNSDPVTITAGSRFKTINGEDSVVFVSGDEISAGVYELTCETPGIIGNSYTGAILPITAINGLASATIGTIITVGADEETDDALRSRYKQSLEVQPGQGNIADYQRKLLQIPGVGASEVYPYPSLNLAAIVILDDTFNPATQELVDEVQAIIDPVSGEGMGFAPIGATINIFTAPTYSIDVAATITWAPGRGGASDIQAVEDALDTYMQDENKSSWATATVVNSVVTYTIAIYISKAIAAVLAVDGVENVTGLTFNGSSSDLIRASQDRITSGIFVLGTVTLT